MKNPLAELRGTVGFDSETTGLNPWRGDRAFSWAFADENDKTVYLRWKVDPFTRIVKPDPRHLDWLQEFFIRKDIVKVAHNAKFDVRMLEMDGIKVAGALHDSMIMVHCLRTLEPTLKLKPLAKKYLDISDEDEDDLQKSVHKARREGKKLGWMIATEETHGKKPAFADYWMAPKELNEKYNVTDAVRTLGLCLLGLPLLDEEKVREVYEEEMRLFWVSYRMESRGVRVDPKVIDAEIKRNEKILAQVTPKIDKFCPGLNVNSPKQLQHYLFTKKRHKAVRFTDTGQSATGTEVLLSLAEKEPICKLIIEAKTAQKAVSSFFGRFRWLAREEKDGLILHANFKQVGTVTARFACADPNLQNVADPYGTRAPIPIPARMAFIPRKGYVWYHVDYKAMEAWLFSSPAIAHEKKMLAFLLSGQDLPTAIALEMGWGKQLEEDKKNNRGVTRIRAKLMLYGIIYGIAAPGLALLNKISIEEARKDLDVFYERFPGIAEYMEKSIRIATRDGFVRGPLGRKFQSNADVAYKAANYIVQGSAAQVLKRAMIDCDALLRKHKIDGHLIMTIHDELAFEISRKHETMKNILLLKKQMESYGALFGIPKLPVDVERVRENWMDKETIDFDFKKAA